MMTAITGTLDALLAACEADPLDRGPRLVLADYVEEMGDSQGAWMLRTREPMPLGDGRAYSFAPGAANGRAYWFAPGSASDRAMEWNRHWLLGVNASGLSGIHVGTQFASYDSHGDAYADLCRVYVAAARRGAES